MLISVQNIGLPDSQKNTQRGTGVATELWRHHILEMLQVNMVHSLEGILKHFLWSKMLMLIDKNIHVGVDFLHICKLLTRKIISNTIKSISHELNPAKSVRHTLQRGEETQITFCPCFLFTGAAVETWQFSLSLEVARIFAVFPFLFVTILQLWNK